MGACLTTPEDAEAKARSKEIERALKADSSGETLKLLLLGPGESGKSTIFKQIQIIHQKGFAEDERLANRKFVHRNVLQSTKALLGAAGNQSMELRPENRETAAKLRDAPLTVWNQDLGEDCLAIWNDPAIQKVYTRRAEFQLTDSTAYFFENMDRINESGYMPSDQDLLRIRIPTTGIVENEWQYKGKKFTILDMGGQRSERRKWIHHFDGVTAILFVASLSDYNQVLYEDTTTNRMHESIHLFDTICTNDLFKDTPIILFLNKVDLFREKIALHDLKCCFPEYTGGCDYDAAIKYIEDKFCEASERHSQERSIYTRHTCATDTATMAFVFEATADIILRGKLQELNLL
eukprot:TRINITY_DN854_c0_g1_i1.p1 TRINITY_DN854_c0_g1~~TRINITY_DN854_c0_g1_i1.p1  ORF type:complete len:350 (+),score=139.46 TRINITY_DN854_c0_g1_i1:60-1109(+)